MAKVLKADPSVTYPVAMNASAAASEGYLYGINSSGAGLLADCSTPVFAVGFAFRDLSAANSALGKPVILYQRGIIELTASDITGGWTIGAGVYLSTAGKWTTVKPSTNAYALQPVGVAVSATRVLVDVANHRTLFQTAATSTVSM